MTLIPKLAEERTRRLVPQELCLPPWGIKGITQLGLIVRGWR